MNRLLFAISAAALAFATVSGWAQTACPTPIGVDTDGDGFDDALELAGIQVLNTPALVTDPAIKDVFVILAPATSGSLLPPQANGAPFNPFVPVSFSGSGINVSFNGLTPLGLNVHVLAPSQAAADRTVDACGISTQKAVRIGESTDTNGTILGNCQWGTPDGIDGCVVYTQRIKNFIDTNCPGNTPDERALMFNAYITESFLHETGHSMGGLASVYNSRNGGYHYKSGSALIMEQSVTYTSKGGRCTWNVSSAWNQSLDVPAVRLNP
jgi:hypothetical protein